MQHFDPTTWQIFNGFQDSQTCYATTKRCVFTVHLQTNKSHRSCRIEGQSLTITTIPITRLAHRHNHHPPPPTLQT
jgi:hypothetical protein